MQSAILEDVPACARYYEFRATNLDDAVRVLGILGKTILDSNVIGIGAPLVEAIGGHIDALHSFPRFDDAPVIVPSTQADLWLWVRGADMGDVFDRGRMLRTLVEPGFDLVDATNAFCFKGGHDLTGYEDGTENPEGEEATAAAFDSSGGSFVAVQRWHHKLDQFESFPESERDDIIGRRLADNVELDDAPITAHVQRTAQESFSPEAFVLRRSMPWSDGRGEGLMFVAFGHSLDAFEAQMRRMAGLEDGETDALFRFSQPATGACYWCPPRTDAGLDLSALRL